MGTYGETPEGEDAETEIATAVDTAFRLERDLQAALRRSIEQLEEGLSVIDGYKERVVPSGKVDITARDRNGVTVIIELKKDTADRDAIGQILSYIGDSMKDGEKVRGILVASEFTPRAVSAARESVRPFV